VPDSLTSCFIFSVSVDSGLRDSFVYLSHEDDKKSIFIGYFNLGYSYGKEGYHKKAIGAYKKFIEIKPNDHKAYYNMGISYIKLKEYQKAIDAFKKAIL
jgi:tetratricopeptide (TPR) repeat protein